MTPDQIRKGRGRRDVQRQRGRALELEQLQRESVDALARSNRVALALLDRHRECTDMARFCRDIGPRERVTWNEKADRALAELRAFLVTGQLP